MLFHLMFFNIFHIFCYFYTTMKKKLFIAIALGMMTWGQSCIYSESGIYLVEPVPGDPPSIEASSNLDTIADPVLVDSLEVIYSAGVENGLFYGLETYYLNDLVYNSDTTSGSFWLKPATFQLSGVDTLYLYFFFSTNSNSLADILELEYNYVSLKYPVTYETGGVK